MLLAFLSANMFQRKLEVMVQEDVSENQKDLEAILQKDFDALVKNILKSQQSSLLIECHKSEVLKLWSWSRRKRGIDGLTTLKYDKKKNKYVDVYIEEKVLRSDCVCWRMAVLLHELGHALHYFSKKVTKKKPVKPCQNHGKCWKNVLKKAVKRGNLKICASWIESPEERCQFKGACQWCLPHNSVMTREFTSIPEESPYGGVCLFCDTKAIRPIPHIKNNLECLQEYVIKYGLGYKVFVSLGHAKLRRRKKRTRNNALESVCRFCPAFHENNLPNHLSYSKMCQQKYNEEYCVETLEDLKGKLKK